MGGRLDLKFKISLGFGALIFLANIPCYAYEYNGININGFISQGYLHTNHNDYLADTKGGTLDFNEMGLNLGYQLNDSFLFGAQILSRNLGVDGDNKVTFGYVSGDYNINRYIGLRAGKVRIPMGLYNQTRDVDMLRLGVFLPNAVYHDEVYSFFSAFYGGLLYGNTPVNSAGNIEYEFFAGIPVVDSESYYVKNQSADFGRISRLGVWAGPPYSDLAGDIYGRDIDAEAEGDKTYGFAVRWNTPMQGLRMGYSRLFSESTFKYTDVPYIDTIQTKNKTNPFQVLSLEYTYDDLVISAEYMTFDIEFQFDYPVNPYGFEDFFFDPDPYGYYLGASYRYSDLMQFGITYSEFYFDDKDKGGNVFVAQGRPDFLGWLKDITFSARFDITDYWIVKAEYHFMDGAAWLPEYGLYGDANATPNSSYDAGLPENLKQKWNMIALKTAFSF